MRKLAQVLLLVLLGGCSDTDNPAENGPGRPTVSQRLERAAELEELGLFQAAAEEWAALRGEVPSSVDGELRALCRADTVAARLLANAAQTPLSDIQALALYQMNLRQFQFDEAWRQHKALRGRPGVDLQDTAWLESVAGESWDLVESFEDGLSNAWTVHDPNRVAKRGKLLRSVVDFEGFGRCSRPVRVEAGALRMRLRVANLLVEADGRARVVIGLGREQPVLGWEIRLGGNQQRFSVAVFGGEGSKRVEIESTAAGKVFPRSSLVADLCVVPGQHGATLHWRVTTGESEEWTGRLRLKEQPLGDLKLGVLDASTFPGTRVAVDIDSFELSGEAVTEGSAAPDPGPELLGNLAAANGDPLKAERDYSKGIRSHPFNLELYRLRGQMRAQLGEYSHAARDLAIYASQPRRPVEPLNTMLDDIERMDAFKLRNLVLLEIKAQLEPFGELISPERSRRALAGLQAQIAAGRSPFDKPKFLARAHVVFGNFEQASEILTEAVLQASGAERGELLLQRGEAFLLNANVLPFESDRVLERDKAKQDFSAAREYLPSSEPAPLLKLAKAYLLNKESSAAHAACTQALEIRDDLAEAYYRRGMAQMSHRTAHFAVADLEKAIELDPSNGYYYYDLGNALSFAKKDEESQQAYRRALQLGYLEAAKQLE